MVAARIISGTAAAANATAMSDRFIGRLPSEDLPARTLIPDPPAGQDGSADLLDLDTRCALERREGGEEHLVGAALVEGAAVGGAGGFCERQSGAELARALERERDVLLCDAELEQCHLEVAAEKQRCQRRVGLRRARLEDRPELARAEARL